MNTTIRSIFIKIIMGIMIAVTLAITAIEIYIWCAYSGCAVDEIPTWALFFMLRR